MRAKEVSRQVGADELTESPTAVANPCKTKASAAAANAPAITGPHSILEDAGSMTTASKLLTVLSCLAKAEERQNRQNDDDQADEID